MELSFPKEMFKELDSFFTLKTITDVDRTKYIPFVFKDNKNRLTTCLMFNCNMHKYEDPTIIESEYTGVVVHLPAFWVEVPKELAMTYLYNLLYEEVYQGIYKQWAISGHIGNYGPKTEENPIPTCKCPCGPNAGWVQIG